MSNIIDTLADASPELARLRRRRPEAVENAELTFTALFEPDDEGDVPLAWRYGVAAFVAGLTGLTTASAFYRELLEDLEDQAPGLAEAVDDAVARGASEGPYWHGDFVLFGDVIGEASEQFAAALDFAHLLVFHPKDSTAAAIGHLQTSGWSDNGIVTLGQLIAFVAFQLRVVHGVRVLGGVDAGGAQRASISGRAHGVADPGWEPGPRTLLPEVVVPTKFVEHSLGWRAWVPSLDKSEFTEVHRDALLKPERIDMEYFRLLARDPAVLKARTLTDLDIFYNTDGGLGRAERELAATVVSRLNGCEYCASVHQGRAKQEGGDAEAISRLLAEGVTADLGTPLWNALRDAAVALTHTPIAFSQQHVEALREAGCGELEILDLINSAAFFNWANRLMLSLGAADVPKRYR